MKNRKPFATVAQRQAWQARMRSAEASSAHAAPAHEAALTSTPGTRAVRAAPARCRISQGSRCSCENAAASSGTSVCKAIVDERQLELV